MDNNRPRPSFGMTPHRIEALNDGVFAIAMTLLILNIDLPKGRQSLAAISGFFMRSSPQFFDYGLSFILLAFLWTAQHRQYHWIKRIDDRLLWINMIFLLFIAMVPLSTALYGDYRALWPTALFINVNLLLVFLTLYGMWVYVTGHPELLDPSLTDEHIAFTRRPSVMIIPILSLLAVVLSFIIPSWSTVPYILVPFIMTRQPGKDRTNI